MGMRLLRLGVAIFLLVGLSACGGGYYKVTDPATDKVYYSSDVEEQKGGAIKLTDANTGSRVTLQNSEVTQINKEEFKANTKKE